MSTTAAASIPSELQQQQQYRGGSDSRFGCNICLEPVVEPVVTLCGHLYCWPCLFRWLEPGMSEPESRELSWQRTGRTTSYSTDITSRRSCPVCKNKCSVSTVIPIYIRHPDDVLRSLTSSTFSMSGSNSSNNNLGIMATTGSIQQQQQQNKQLGQSQGTETVTAELFIEEEEERNISDQTSDSLPPTQHLRRRIRFNNNNNNNTNRPLSSSIPSRPAYIPSQSEPHPPSSRFHHNNNNASSASSSSPPGSLSTSLALSLQEALFGNNHPVPSLHHPQHNIITTTTENGRAPATEFLSRVLLMLGSFVILCLLLF